MYLYFQSRRFICYFRPTKTLTMRISLLAFFVFVLVSCGTNKNVYKSADFETKAYRHHTIAILPFNITQTGHKSKNTTDESIKETNHKWGYTFQESLQAYLLKYTSKNKKGPIISFQSLQKTNAILAENNLDIEELYLRKPEELAKLLGVDAVLMTTLENQKNFSDGVAYGLAAGRTILNAIGQGAKTIGLNMNVADINMSCYLYDAGDSKLLWQTYRKGGADLPTQVDDLVQYYSNWIAKKFPYKS
jgi:hypothetical protein